MAFQRNDSDFFGQNLAFLSGIGLGAGLMYVFDPERGRRRRAHARDQLVAAVHELGCAADKTGRDLAHRAEGIVAELVSSVRGESDVDDAVLEQRVRAQLGRVVSHPGAIEVTAENGRVGLSGPVLAAEVDELIDAVTSIRGVTEVDNRMEVHDSAEGVPGLQGGRGRPSGPRWDVMQTNWAPATRFLVGLGGASLAMFGASRRSVFGGLLGAGGLALLGRAATNMEVRRMFGAGGGRAGIRMQKTINIFAPVEEVYALWSDPENFPRIMSHVRRVKRESGNRYRWTVDGPAGAPVSWEAEVTQQVPNQVIAWRSVPGALVRNAGIIRFQWRDGATSVHILLSYNPPGGAIGHAVAALFGKDPKHALDDDLVRLKSLLETGKTTAHGESVRKEDVLPEGKKEEIA